MPRSETPHQGGREEQSHGDKRRPRSGGRDIAEYVRCLRGGGKADVGVFCESEVVMMTVGRQMMVCVRDIRGGRCDRCRTEEGADEEQTDRRP